MCPGGAELPYLARVLLLCVELAWEALCSFHIAPAPSSPSRAFVTAPGTLVTVARPSWVSGFSCYYKLHHNDDPQIRHRGRTVLDGFPMEAPEVTFPGELRLWRCRGSLSRRPAGTGCHC